MATTLHKDEKMPDNVNSVIPPCPFCGSVPSQIGNMAVHRCRAGVDLRVDIKYWKTRPGEDAARLKQFQQCVKVVRELTNQEPPAEMGSEAHGYQQGIIGALEAMRGIKQ